MTTRASHTPRTSLFDTPLVFDERNAAIEQLHAATALYTVDAVVDALLDKLAWPRGMDTLLDPACGDGIFLGRALARLLRTRPDLPRTASAITALLRGWEIHRDAAAQARDRIAEILRHHGWNEEEAGNAGRTVVENRDFLTDGPTEGERFATIATNPPYLRSLNIPALLRAEYADVVPEHAQGDLLHAFLDRCSHLLTDDGRCGFVSADRFLFNRSAARLRVDLGKRLAITHLTRLDPKTSFYRPKHRRTGTPPRIHPVEMVLRPLAFGGIELGERAIYPDTSDADVAGAPRLRDVARVRLAPWLGAPGIFVVDAAVASTLPADSLVSAVDTDDFLADDTLRTPHRYAIRTGPTPPCGPVMEHLRAELPRMALRGRRTPEWLPPEGWNGLPLSRPSLVVPRIARGIRAIRVPANVLPISHNLSVIECANVSLDRIEAALQDEQTQAWVRARAPRLENGFMSITTTFLQQVPLFALAGSGRAA
jgi:tRNA1(Val) A37 N6-methylase TrmN6